MPVIAGIRITPITARVYFAVQALCGALWWVAVALSAEVRDATLDAATLPALQENYLQAGGAGRLADYFEVHDGRATLLPRLRGRITWAGYNLVTDASFNEFDAIVCCRALADFGPLLRQRVLRLFHDSLSRFGVLGIDRELAPGDAHAGAYKPLLPDLPWYRRVE